MANVTVSGYLKCSDGTLIDLQNTSQAEGTEFDLKPNTTYSVAASQVGDYAPGKQGVAGLIQGHNMIAYAYILRQGLVASIIPVGLKGSAFQASPLCAPFRLQAGDKLRVMNNTAADREAALCVYTRSGVSRIFVVTPTGAATNELVDLQTSNSIGDTLQNEVIIKAFSTSVDTSKIETPGAVVVDSLGNVVGAVPMVSPGPMQPLFNTYSIPINLNFKAQFLTNA